MSALWRTQLRPRAIAASSRALPLDVPATVTRPARAPRRAPVAITRVTIGPGVSTRTVVIRRKVVNSCQFIARLPITPPPFAGEAGVGDIAAAEISAHRPRCAAPSPTSILPHIAGEE